jgi:hypothetical protein
VVKVVVTNFVDFVQFSAKLAIFLKTNVARFGLKMENGIILSQNLHFFGKNVFYVIIT